MPWPAFRRRLCGATQPLRPTRRTRKEERKNGRVAMGDQGTRPAMPQSFETPRLSLRPFSAGDAEAAFQWLGDPEVMRFIPTGPDPSVEGTRRRVARYRDHQARHGFSRWIVRERGSGEAVGDSGLVFLESGSIDLGFRFARAWWGQGFATEVATAWIRVAFVDLRLDRLTAFAHPQNLASLHVLEKVGFRKTSAERIMGMEAFTFVLDARDRPLVGEAEPG